jgi:hypothetical protein
MISCMSHVKLCMEADHKNVKILQNILFMLIIKNTTTVQNFPVTFGRVNIESILVESMYGNGFQICIIINL